MTREQYMKDLAEMVEADYEHLREALASGNHFNAHGFVDAIIINQRTLEDMKTAAKTCARIATKDADIVDNGDGTFTVNGVSVGSPEIQPCGCPGAATITVGALPALDTCVRCGRPASA